jgi:hypothetical protein
MRGSNIVVAEGIAECAIVKDFAAWKPWNRAVKLYCESLSTDPVDNSVDDARITD